MPWVLVGLVSATASGTSPEVRAEPARYRFDPTHTFVHFEVLHFDTATVRGRWGPLDGEVDWDRTQRRGRVQVRVETAQVSTGLPVLDQLLRGAALLDTVEHPFAYFVGEQFVFNDNGFPQEIRGEFTLRGVSRPLTLTAERFRCYLNPLFRKEVCGGDFVAELQRSQFGIEHSLPWVADSVRLRIQIEALREP
jgi:polyisoprenoid-binding protein YceI